MRHTLAGVVTFVVALGPGMGCASLSGLTTPVGHDGGDLDGTVPAKDSGHPDVGTTTGDGGKRDGTVGCGGAGQPCCNSSACDKGATCGGGACLFCGGIGEPCCNESACNGGLVCGKGVCSASDSDSGTDSGSGSGSGTGDGGGCPVGWVACGGACVYPGTNVDHCGATVGCGAGGEGSAGVSCASGEYCVQGACTGPPASYLSPDGLETQASHPVTIDFSIGTASAATIYYTTDGTDPAPDAGTTKAAASPVVLAAVGNGTTLRWFASYGGTAGREPSTQQMLVTTTTPGDSYGTVVQHVKFAATGGPVVQVAPGATVTGAVDYEYWPDNAAGQCPSCVCQWTLGVDSVGQIACQVFEFNGSNGFPGKSGTQDFSFTAPTTPGVYIMRQGFAEKFSCGEAGSAGEDVGEVVVAL